jgi:hypothetical protein
MLVSPFFLSFMAYSVAMKFNCVLTVSNAEKTLLALVRSPAILEDPVAWVAIIIEDIF